MRRKEKSAICKEITGGAGSGRPKKPLRGRSRQRLFGGAKGHQPFTAPATTPSMMYFWQIRYMMMIGSTVIMMQAIIGAISTRP